MRHHRRQVRLLAILARLGWQRNPELSTISCLDGHGQRAHLSVRMSLGWVRLDCPAAGPLYLDPCHALRLRVAVREVVGDLALFGGADGAEPPAQPAPTPNDPSVPPHRRLVVFRCPPPRPTVADIAARLADSPTPAEQEAERGDHIARQSQPASLAA